MTTRKITHRSESVSRRPREICPTSCLEEHHSTSAPTHSVSIVDTCVQQYRRYTTVAAQGRRLKGVDQLYRKILL